MADVKREIERKYEATDGELPGLVGAGGVAEVVDRGVVELDATYYDTADERLGAASLTLRRRTGGSDAGWHLKFPVAPGVRDEIRAPLADTVPEEIAALVRSRVRGAELVPVVRLRSARDVRHLVDADGALLAEASVDTVTAERLNRAGGTARWTEIEVELADGADPALLDAVEERLGAAGVRPSKASSKVGEALRRTGGSRARPGRAAEPVTAGDHVLAHLREQREAILARDPGVRRDLPDSVHQMRVATRRLRSAFRSFRSVLDPDATAPVAAELKWLARELGVDRDQEVLADRLTEALDALPPGQVTGPVRERLASWATARHGSTRGHLLGVLDSARYLALLDSLDVLLADPPLRRKAAGKPRKVLTRALEKEGGKLSRLIEAALELPPGEDRDHALHEARKRAKRARYAAEAAVPALGGPARALARRAKKLTSLLGEHQDSVLARQALRELAAVAHAAGESAFTYGVLYEREEQAARRTEAELPGRWRKARSAFPG
ncbi:CYTH and CHAD domain-containing protein [Streptomyces sp. NBC_00566]|uniref:CYTH and CHAD domain-containing protein n=1 Tax=Streptomyces sp. NBC_00566 TaxID=2975778 RepID=UPI002E80C079|nr:CYTH and CHAD domain-containing protein [Streptomyces sp. NBC_00566]WUB88770.1 CYTH and CHAD domain-containing protein [Streptomyces sp. NBC_00566]